MIERFAAVLRGLHGEEQTVTDLLLTHETVEICWTELVVKRRRTVQFLAHTFTHAGLYESFKVTVRLKTGAPGFESYSSATK